VTVGKEESDSVGEEDTLLHGETLLVVSAGNSEDVALPLVTDAERCEGKGLRVRMNDWERYVKGKGWIARLR
jgi:hypothetical protein